MDDTPHKTNTIFPVEGRRGSPALQIFGVHPTQLKRVPPHVGWLAECAIKPLVYYSRLSLRISEKKKHTHTHVEQTSDLHCMT